MSEQTYKHIYIYIYASLHGCVFVSVAWRDDCTIFIFSTMMALLLYHGEELCNTLQEEAKKKKKLI